MKRKKLRRLVEDVLEASRALDRSTVMIRTVSVDFDARTITIDGRRINVDTVGIDFPILSGDAVFIPGGGLERIA